MVQMSLPGVTEGVREPSWGRDGDSLCAQESQPSPVITPHPCLLSLGGCIYLGPKFARRVHNAQCLLPPQRIPRSCQVGEP